VLSKKDKEVQLEEIEASHTLGGSCELGKVVGGAEGVNGTVPV